LPINGLSLGEFRTLKNLWMFECLNEVGKLRKYAWIITTNAATEFHFLKEWKKNAPSSATFAPTGSFTNFDSWRTKPGYIIPGDPSLGWRRTLPSSSTSPPIVNTNFAQYYQEIHTAPLTLSEPALFCGFLLECEFADIFTLLQRFYLLYKGKIYYVRSERIILWS